VREAGKAITARPHPVHVLICNAGVGGTHGVTADGFEVAFGTNHLGHFLLTQLLLEKLRASAPARVVVVSSRGHYDARRPDWDRVKEKTRSFTGLPEYAVSKLANVLFAAELGRREARNGITAYSLHPGFIASEIWGASRIPGPLQPLAKKFMRSVEDGCVASVRCATDPALAAETGRYYTSDGQPKKPSKLARDKTLAAELWRRSEEWVRG
jgi:NAD(P)-dependent dehydrogenase (short-subunit alcohol dehydrogenase family)